MESKMTIVPLRPAFSLTDTSTFALDLANPKAKEVLAIQEFLNTDIRSNPDLGKLPVKTGWNDIPPAIALNLLRRNRPGANRPLNPSTVFYYAHQMARGDWKKTGQPILIDNEGHLLDAQHRMYAVLVSGATINSYVIVDIENQPGLFAYIDNAATRTPAAALQTAGFNGVASVIVKVIKFAEEVRQGVYDTSGLDQLQRLSPAEILSLAKNYPNAQRASRSAASDWSDASEYLSGRKDIVAYVGMRIIDQHGEDVADDFFHEITNTGDGTPEQILALRTVVDKDLRSDKPMKRHHTAAMLIKVFNAWHRQQSLVRRWMMMVNEDFPVLDDEPQANAAE